MRRPACIKKTLILQARIKYCPTGRPHKHLSGKAAYKAITTSLHSEAINFHYADTERVEPATGNALAQRMFC